MEMRGIKAVGVTLLLVVACLQSTTNGFFLHWKENEVDARDSVQTAFLKPRSQGRRIFSCTPPSSNNSSGTTPHLYEIFMGRCFEWIRINGSNEYSSDHCFQIWQAFNCSLRSSEMDFKPLLDEAAPELTPKSVGVLWSGLGINMSPISSGLLQRTIQKNINKSAVALESTHVGWILNSLKFCPSNKVSNNTEGIAQTAFGFDFETCVYRNGPTEAFWHQASSRFSSTFSKRFHIILNRLEECPYAFRTNSTLYHEISRLQCCNEGGNCGGDNCATKIWNIHEDGCRNDPSLDLLKSMLERYVEELLLDVVYSFLI